MPYHIKKPSLVDESITVFYAGNRRWTDIYEDRIQYADEAAANAVMNNPDGKNGGWRKATVHAE